MSSVFLHAARPQPPVPEPLQDAISIATSLAARLAETANARDQAGGHAAQEREWLRESGLLTLSIPVEFGGQGASFPEPE